MQPTSIGQFQIVRELGRGGMGQVYLARDTRLDRSVAIKALPEHLSQDPDRLTRFQREAKVLASLNHPGIGAIYGLEESAGHQYLVLEFIEGQTLADLLRRGPLPLAEALGLARQIAEALEAAHEKGIVHRDIKPGNIMVTAEGAVKVLDFGLARTTDDAPASSITPSQADSPTLITPLRHSPTMPGAIMGTAGYMSPEQARGKAVDKRSDIFAFGCVFFEMLAGRQSFAGESVADSLGAVLHQEPDWSALPASLPPRIDELLRRCLAKDRRNRLHDIGDARLDLERALSGTDRPAAATPVPATSGGVRLFSAGGLAVAAAMLALGAGTWAMLGRRPAVPADPICLSVTAPSGVALRSMAISPDGTTLVATGQPSDQLTGKPLGKDAAPRIYTRRLNSTEFKPIAGTEGAIASLVPSSSRMFMIAPETEGGMQLRLSRMPLDGSTPPTPVTDWKPAWRSFMHLSTGDLLISEGETSFVRLPAAGGAPGAAVQVEVDRPAVRYFTLTESALPGDQRGLVSVVTYSSRGYQFNVGVLEFATGKVRILIEDGGNARYTSTGHLLFTRAGVILAAKFDPAAAELRSTPVAVWSGLSTPTRYTPAYYQLADNGTLLYRPGPAGGGRPVSLLGADGKLSPWSPRRWEVDGPFRASPNGKQMAFAITNPRGIDEIWLADIDHGELTRLGSDPNVDCFGVLWSPDSTQLAYFRVAKDGKDGIYIQNIDGSPAKRVCALSEQEDGLFPSAWLPDGSALITEQWTGGKTNLKLLPLSGEGAGTLRPFLASEAGRRLALLSPDGKLIAFSSDETGRLQTFVAEMRPDRTVGRPVMIKTAGATTHGWSADGTSLFVQDERRGLYKVSVSPGPTLTVSMPQEIADLDTLRIQNWTPLPGGRFLVTLRNENEGDLTRMDLVLNWTKLLEKATTTK